MFRWLLGFAKKDDTPVRCSPAGLRPDLIHPHALMVIRRLAQSGHAAYIVGGAVRDLLLNLRPKDFDVATSAHPNEVRRLFRHSVIIGRRFRLVHVRFDNHRVVEVATFRRHPGEDAKDEPLQSDNLFGTEREDAFRRDFTLNALFYDVASNQIIDYTGGLQDLKHKILRCIGKPEVRLPEDPVRILRAIKFAAKFGLKIEPHLEKAMVRFKDTIRLCSQRRLFEELLKIFKTGSLACFIAKSNEYGFLEAYFPFLARLNKRDPEALLKIAKACDKAALDGYLEPALAFSLFLWPEIKKIRNEDRDMQVAIRNAIMDFSKDYQISKIDKFIMRNILSIKLRLDYYLHHFHGKRPIPYRKILHLPDLDLAMHFYRMVDEIDQGNIKGWEFWRDKLSNPPQEHHAQNHYSRRPLLPNK